MRWRRCVRAGVLGLCAWSSLALADPPRRLRFFPAAAFEVEGDSIQSGVRVTRLADGSVRVSKERFDGGGVARGVEVPLALGGGYLFFQPLGSSGGATTALFRASHWTDELTPLGTVPFLVSELRPGFDRFYLLGAGRAIAIDPDTGSYLPLDPLPPVATLLDLRFTSAGHGTLRAPIVGTLETADAGSSWRAPTDEPDGVRALPTDEAESRLPRLGQLLRNVVVRGGVLPSGTVLGLVRGARVSFDPALGRLAQAPERSLDPRAECQALAPGELVDSAAAAPLWFECRSPSGLELRAYRLGAPMGTGPAREVVLLRRDVFPAHTRVLAAGRRGVLLDVPCAAELSHTKRGPRHLCLIDRLGRTQLEVQRAAASGRETFAVGTTAVHRLSLLADGGIQSQRLDAREARRVYRIHHEAEIEALVFGGTWLPGATVFEEGISFWATRGESYVGVRLERGGDSARVGAIQRPLRRASIHGRHALAWGASGFARVSRDGGMTFAEVDYPFVSGDSDPNRLSSPDQALALGCGPAGCSLGMWVSVGWGTDQANAPPATPPRIPIPPLGGGRFRFACSPAGDTSPPSLPTLPSGSRTDEPLLARDELVPFWDRQAPRPGPLEVGYSVGDHRGLARLYALGPKEGAWGSRGRVGVSFRSPLSTEDSFESLWSGDLLADAPEAQTRLGTVDRTTQTAYTELDPGGEGGVMLIRTRQEATLFAFSRKSHVRRFDVPEAFGLGTIAGAALTRSGWFIGSIAGGRFRVIELAETGMTEVGSFALGETGPREAVLTRSSDGDLGIAIDGDLGLLVYPVSLHGELGDVLFQAFRGSRPPQCPSEAVGYLVVRELGIAPYVEAFDDELDVSRVTMRRVVGFGPECIDALAADARGPLHPLLSRARPTPPGATSLVITDRAESGRRVRLSCR